MGPMKTRNWTPTEATKSLPLVSRIAQDILASGRDLHEITARESISAEDQMRAEQLSQDLEAYMAELERLGCQYKGWGFDNALIDFPGEIDGKSVLLCWQLGEPKVEWYHDSESGFAGRKPIPRELLAGK